MHFDVCSWKPRVRPITRVYLLGVGSQDGLAGSTTSWRMIQAASGIFFRVVTVQHYEFIEALDVTSGYWGVKNVGDSIRFPVFCVATARPLLESRLLLPD